MLHSNFRREYQRVFPFYAQKRCLEYRHRNGGVMSSGIIRRIDPLGRIVLPKEIRRTLHIEDGDPLEISLSGKRIILDRYFPLTGLKEQSEAFLKVFSKELSVAAAVCSLDTVIFYRGFSLSGDNELSVEMRSLIRSQSVYQYNAQNPVYLTVSSACPINASFSIGTPAKPVGALVLIRDKNNDATDNQMDTAKFIAKALTELTRE